MNEEPTPTDDELGLDPTEGIDLTENNALPSEYDEMPDAVEVDAVEVDAVEVDAVEVDPLASDEPAATALAPTTVYKGAGFRWSMLFGAVLLTIVIIMVVQNTQTTKFDFLQWSIEAPLAALLLGTTLIAVLIDEIVGYIIRIRRRRVKRQLAELKELKAKLEPPKERRFGKKTP